MDPGLRQRKGFAQSGKLSASHHHHHKGHESSMDGHISCLSWMLLMAIFYFSLISLNILMNGHMPTPKSIADSKPNEFTEEGARQHLENFVKLGARPSGSRENDVDTVNYILQTIADIKASSRSSKNIEVDVQRPEGSFYLPHHDQFMSYYANISNTVARITSPESDDNALLLNCHTDSVANAPGASDDAIACSILLEILRAIVADDKPLLHPLIFLFNGAEENILQASHGFITQHKWVKQIKAFINLEAAGAGGKEFLFQTGPENPWLVWAWAKYAPYPHGSSIGQDLFQSGIIPSDTDFRIFRDHGHIPGIDLAYIKNGYVYHTLHDTADMIPPGCAQRAGDNIYEVIRHLVQSHDSLLPDPSEYRHGAVAYFDLFGLHMIILPLRLLVLVNYLTILAVLAYIGRRMVRTQVTGYQSFEYSSKLVKAVAVNILAYTASFLLLAIVAAFLTKTNHSLSWYSHPPLIAGLYLPAALMGSVTVHCLAKMSVFKGEDARKLESLSFDATLVMWTSLIFQLRNISSSHIFVIPTLFAIIGRGFFGKDMFSNYSSVPGINRVVLYLGFMLLPIFLLIGKLLIVSDFFVTLAGRTGSELPPEVIIFVLVGISVMACFSYQVCTVYLVNSLKLFYVTMVACFACSLAFAFSPYCFPFDNDSLSPANKRFYMQHVQREFFGADESLHKNDSGLLLYHIDYTQLNYDLGPRAVMSAPILDCDLVEDPFCDMPFPLPLGKMLRKVQYIPAPSPPSSSTTELYPFDVKWKSTSGLWKNGVREVRLDISIQGPPYMTVQFTPFVKGSLVDWSLEGKPKGRHCKYSNRETYFVLYGGGVSHPTWNFWLRLSIAGPESGPVLSLAVAAHYKPSGPVLRVSNQTPELETVTSQLHDWVAQITWPSLYKNFNI